MVAKLFRRYLAFLVGLALIVLAVNFVPSISSKTTSGSTAASSSGGPASSITPAAAPGSPGKTKGGIACGPNIRQVSWSVYSPICEPSWNGNNGGATAAGVTGSTITVTYRDAISSEAQALYSLIPATIIGTNAEEVNTLQSFINVFNSSFELYGRHVVLKPFTGQGDFISEQTGGGQTQAQADAVTAHDLGAFADVSFIDASFEYTQYLEQQQIISFPQIMQPSSTYKANSPWWWSPGPTCDKSAAGMSSYISRAMANLPAIFAGDPNLVSSKRVFGLVSLDNPSARQCTGLLSGDMSRDGTAPAKTGVFSFDMSSMASQIAGIISQMKAAGVTTLIYTSSDPVTPNLLMNAAAQQNYHPEWMFMPYFGGGNIDADAISRPYDQSEMAHAIVPGVVSGPAQAQESYKVFEMGMPGGDLLPTYNLAFTYAPMLMLFSALQGAGPDLTPQSFAKAMHSAAPSVSPGMYGSWKFGAASYDPATSYQLLWWDPTAVSNQDGLIGAFEPCNNGAEFLYSNGAANLPDHQQLDCFNRASP